MRQHHGARPAAAEDESMLGRSHVVAETVSSRSLFDKCRTYTVPDDLRAAGLFTFFRTIESGQDPVVTMGGREMVMLGSNNYLGLTSHPKIKERAIEAVRKERAGGAEVKKFKHNDPADLRRLLALNGDRNGRFLVVDGVFSMEGDIAPLPEYTRICDDYDVAFMVDDAHGVGVLGKHGRGTAEHFGLEDKVDLIMGTFSKSLATVGGFVVGEPDVIKYVKHRARALMFTAAPPPASVAAALAALDIIESEPERRERLWENTRFMMTALRAIGFDCGNSTTPVIPIVVGPDEVAFQMAKRLDDEGVFVNAVVSPVSPPCRALIRTSYMATHTTAHLTRALEAFRKVGREMGLVS